MGFHSSQNTEHYLNYKSKVVKSPLKRELIAAGEGGWRKTQLGNGQSVVKSDWGGQTGRNLNESMLEYKMNRPMFIRTFFKFLYSNTNQHVLLCASLEGFIGTRCLIIWF